jgi:hypothetical protein
MFTHNLTQLIRNVFGLVAPTAHCADQTILTGQGCSVLKDADIIKDIIKVHTVFKEFKADVFNVVFAQDVEGKTSQFSKDMRISADTRFVFAHGHIADVVISVFNAPMIADSQTKLTSAQEDG